jgi:hypothetical protein
MKLEVTTGGDKLSDNLDRPERFPYGESEAIVYQGCHKFPRITVTYTQSTKDKGSDIQRDILPYRSPALRSMISRRGPRRRVKAGASRAATFNLGSVG